MSDVVRGWGGSYCKVGAKCAAIYCYLGSLAMELEKKGKCNVWSEVRGDNIFIMENAMRVWREYLESENFETYYIFIILKIIQIPI